MSAKGLIHAVQVTFSWLNQADLQFGESEGHEFPRHPVIANVRIGVSLNPQTSFEARLLGLPFTHIDPYQV